MLNKLFKNMLIPAILLLVFSVAAFLFFYSNIIRKNEEFQKTQLEWQIENKKFDDIKQLERSMKAIEVERSALQKHFAKSSDVVPFLDSIEKLADSVSVKAEITSVDVGKNDSSLTILIRSSGSFGNLYKFLTLLENSTYELDFISVDMQKTSGPDIEAGIDVPQWEGRFKVALISFLP